MSVNPQRLADELITQLDAYYSKPETFDNELDRQIHEWYAGVSTVWPKRPYFSPSAANACPRELYYKAIRAPKDKHPKEPHQGRWQAIGTAIGDVIQRDILAMERRDDVDTPFVFERNSNGEPMFEDFAKKNKKVEHDGHTFYLYGTCDGIMRYTDAETGEVIRVGLEVKSKQTSAAKTSRYSMREPDEKHVKQVLMYGEMYDVDRYIILYVNASKKSWSYSEEEYEKTPDIRAFGIEVTEAAKNEVFDYLTAVQQSVVDNDPLPLDPTKFTFNNFKTAISLDLTDEEVEEVRSKKNRALRSGIPKFQKQAYTDCLAFIERVREERKEQSEEFIL